MTWPLVYLRLAHGFVLLSSFSDSATATAAVHADESESELETAATFSRLLALFLLLVGKEGAPHDKAQETLTRRTLSRPSISLLHMSTN